MVQTAQKKRELSTRAPPPPSGRLGSARRGRGLGLGLGLGYWILGFGSWVLGLGGGHPAQ
ncbi:hypothetical protein F2Q68_00044935 [Brassica cretica]|uniref:Uncharacterized protein n=1 Tax=Brassica cretica TaxID=69181 RepID=A0A8S9LRB4_BRACR|nr:hypothetical protein F2Q68_00044935 [Brassica cretica]